MKHWSENSQNYTLISFFVIHMWLLWNKVVYVPLMKGNWCGLNLLNLPAHFIRHLPYEGRLFNHSINFVYNFFYCRFKIFFDWSAESRCVDVSSTSEFCCNSWDIRIFWSHWTFDTISFFSYCHCDFWSADFLDYCQSISCLFIIDSVIF